MAQTRSLTIACLLICTLVATNTVMCTAAINGMKTIKTGPLTSIGKPCTNDFYNKACHGECSKLPNTAGIIKTRRKAKNPKSGKCIPSGVTIGPLEGQVCACCMVV
ncbi:hypothetical protein MKW98_008148 [Papaver atlanticum]|uniref:Uncharacterized protein n=1 Tax=Papaver atlanticum TaxID=357466 RepID=A0AAD4X996_9MAGN|nr:hypothetical protein MKW98_008148 [Papaver atlanticum]